MTTDSFSAERQPNGDVWIRTIKHFHFEDEPEIIIIPKEHCAELAELLCPKCAPDYAIDFTMGKGEPE